MLDYPSLQPYANVTTAAFPRISPELEYLVLDRQKTSGAVMPLTGHAGWGLGPGWENLRTLKLAGLSHNGVRLCLLHLSPTQRTQLISGPGKDTSHTPATAVRPRFYAHHPRPVDPFLGLVHPIGHCTVRPARLAQAPHARHERHATDGGRAAADPGGMSRAGELCAKGRRRSAVTHEDGAGPELIVPYRPAGQEHLGADRLLANPAQQV